MILTREMAVLDLISSFALPDEPIRALSPAEYDKIYEDNLNLVKEEQERQKRGVSLDEYLHSIIRKSYDQ